MAYVKVNDQMPEHPKVMRALESDPLAGWMLVCGIAYSNRNRTDGFIPRAKVPLLTPARRPKSSVDALVAAELWHEVDGGYMIHDYLEHQASSDHILKKLRRDSARKSNGSRAESE